MSGTYIKVNGQWRLLPQDIKKNGSWEDVTNAWIKENGAWTLYRTENVPVEYLVVAGGGGGSSNDAGYDPAGGGGGAGGYLTNVYGEDKPGTSTDGGTTVTADTNWVPFTLTTGEFYPISVGGGGAKGNSGAKGGYGGNSTFVSIVSTGGGGGGGVGANGNPGGSGGGKGSLSGTGTGSATGVSGQGRRGGRYSGSDNQGAGGGGAGQYPNTSSKGGDGLYNNITGTSTPYAGGGGSYAGSGGVGGGGNGGTSGVGGNATANTGGGGGGSGNEKATGGGGKTGGLGGSGVVIFRIPINYFAVFDAGISYTEDISSVLNYRVYTVTGGTGNFIINGSFAGPYLNNLSLLVFADEANGSTSTTDYSPNTKTFTFTGNAQVSSTQSKFGGSSLYTGSSYPGGNDIATNPSNDFAFGTDPFTIEFWYWHGRRYVGTIEVSNVGAILLRGNATPGGGYYPGGTLMELDDLDYYILVSADPSDPLNVYNLGFYLSNGNGSNEIVAAYTSSSGTTFARETWNHIVLTRESDGHFYFYINGVKTSKIYQDDDPRATRSTELTTTAKPLFIGGYDWYGSPTQNTHLTTSPTANSFIDDIRITKGIAIYTEDFTPPVFGLKTFYSGEKGG
jgi:hypothetical protein